MDIPPEVYYKYNITKKIGKGANGIVYKVVDLVSGKEFAMKKVKKIPLKTERAFNEIKSMENLKHPGIITIHEVIVQTDSVFMILELMKGGDLRSRIANGNHLTESTSKLYFYQLCLAIKYLHGKGISHRDIKPENILLESDEENTLVKLADFGSCTFVQQKDELESICYTPLYAAPEIVNSNGIGAFEKEVDLWSLGVVLYGCLNGCLP